nr:hypothetical protein [Tanacetum cinerariifolium]
LKNSFESLMEADKVLDIAKPDDNVGPHDENVLEDEDDDVEEVFCGKGRGYQRKAHQYLKNGSKHSHYSSFRFNFVWEKKQPNKTKASTYKLDENATRETSKQNVTNEVHKQPSNSQKKGFVDDGINLMTLKNSFESLMEADKVLDIAKPDDNVGPQYSNYGSRCFGKKTLNLPTNTWSNQCKTNDQRAHRKSRSNIHLRNQNKPTKKRVCFN